MGSGREGRSRGGSEGASDQVTIYMETHVNRRILFREEDGRWARADGDDWVPVVMNAEEFLTVNPFVKEVGDHVLGRSGDRYLVATTAADGPPANIVDLATGAVYPCDAKRWMAGWITEALRPILAADEKGQSWGRSPNTGLP